MKLHNILPKSEQLVLFINTSIKNNKFDNNSTYLESFNNIMKLCAEEIYGISYKELISIGEMTIKNDIKSINMLSDNNNLNNNTFDSSVLIFNENDIYGSIIQSPDIDTGKMLALNAYLEIEPSGYLGNPFKTTLTDINPIYNLIQLYKNNTDNINMNNIYNETILNNQTWNPIDINSNTNISNNINSTNSNNINDVNILSNNDSDILLDNFIKWQPEQYQLLSYINNNYTQKYKFPKRSSMVQITNTNCLCPNCNSNIDLLLLNDDQKLQVRTALMKIASTKSINSAKNLQNFANWLNNQKEFTYIVDGANVAYNRQNFDNGKFNYKQIELVVKKLLESNSGRIVVLIPYAYTQSIVPNSVKSNNRTMTYLTYDDMRILGWLQKENMLYIVPQGADDDWYWLYATIADNHKDIAYVVTNDLIRDHRLAFQNDRTYLRWKTSNVIHFDVIRINDDDDADDNNNDNDVYETLLMRPGKYIK